MPQYRHRSRLLCHTIAATSVAKPFLIFVSGDNLNASILIKQQNERKVSRMTPTTEMYSMYVLRKPAINLLNI